MESDSTKMKHHYLKMSNNEKELQQNFRSKLGLEKYIFLCRINFFQAPEFQY